jgi:ATP-dependent Clp protease ATP-binding subunit ClpA
MSFVLFDEIEKASDSLWNLLLGILDKGTLTLGDNRKVDFSRAMIFMTSNLGASEMNALVNPKLGFIACRPGKPPESGAMDQELDGNIVRSGLEAARKKFTPEFINRIDRIVTFALPLDATSANVCLTLGGVPKSDQVSSGGVNTASRDGQASRIIREKSAFGASS